MPAVCSHTPLGSGVWIWFVSPGWFYRAAFTPSEQTRQKSRGGSGVSDLSHII